MIEDLLSFSRLSRQEIALSTIEMEALATTVFHELNTENELERINFTISHIPDALGDSAMIRQVWVNLISNAIKFTSHKSVRTIEIGYSIINDDCVYHIKDNGAGFDMNYIHKLFGVFQRLHTTKDFDGTGVGLAIVHRIINRHNGLVWAEAVVDQGATFYFTLSPKGVD